MDIPCVIVDSDMSATCAEATGTNRLRAGRHLSLQTRLREQGREQTSRKVQKCFQIASVHCTQGDRI